MEGGLTATPSAESMPPGSPVTSILSSPILHVLLFLFNSQSAPDRPVHERLRGRCLYCPPLTSKKTEAERGCYRRMATLPGRVRMEPSLPHALWLEDAQRERTRLEGLVWAAL